MTKLLRELHYTATHKKKHVLLFIIESLLFLYIIWWAVQRIDPGVHSSIIMVFYLVASYIGMIFAFSELRFHLAITMLVLFLTVIYSLFFIAISALQLYYPDTHEYTLFFFQKIYYIISIIILLGFTFKWFLFRWKAFFYIEVFLTLTVMVLLFKVHRIFPLSRLNLFDSFLNIGLSEIMIFFVFIFLLFVLVLVFFLVERDSSPLRSHRHSFVREKQHGLKTIIGLLTLIIVVAAFMYQRVKEEEPKRSSGIPQQFNENDFLNLYPKVNMNTRERKLVVKMEIKDTENFVGKIVSADNQYIRWKVLSAYDPNRNLFKYKQNKFEKDIPRDSEDHYYKYEQQITQSRIQGNPTNILLGLGQLFTFQGFALTENMSSQLTKAKESKPGNYLNRKHLDQEYYVIRFPKAANLAINSPTLIKPIKNKNPRLFTSSYRAESQVFAGEVEPLLDVKTYEDLDKEFMEHYTAGPLDPAYKILAESLTKQYDRPVMKMIALVRHLTSEYTYSLSPGGETKPDLLSYFLFTNKKGYCTYFAFALTALARSIKIPSRVVVGFLTDPYNKKENYYLLHAKNMHAWVEVYFKEYGWITFDGTPSPEFGTNFLSDMDYLNKLIESLEKETEDESLSKDQLNKQQWKQEDDKPLNLLLLLFLFPLGMLAIYSYKNIYKYIGLREKDPLRRIYLVFNYITNSLKDNHIKRQKGETHQQYAQRIYQSDHIDIRGITSLYLTGKFSDKVPESWPTDTLKGLGDWETSMRKRFPLWKRYISRFNISFFLNKNK